MFEVVAALIVQAMADRSDTVVLGAVLKAAQQGDRNVRMSAINALRQVGDDSCLSVLLQIAIEDDPDLARTAKETLPAFQGSRLTDELSYSCRTPRAKPIFFCFN